MCCEWCLVCIQKAFLGQWIHYVAPDRTPSQITIFISIFIVESGGFFTTSFSEAGFCCVNDLLTDIHFTYLFERQRGPHIHSAITSSWETWGLFTQDISFSGLVLPVQVLMKHWITWGNNIPSMIFCTKYIHHRGYYSKRSINWLSLISLTS